MTALVEHPAFRLGFLTAEFLEESRLNDRNATMPKAAGQLRAMAVELMGLVPDLKLPDELHGVVRGWIKAMDQAGRRGDIATELLYQRAIERATFVMSGKADLTAKRVVKLILPR